MKDYSNGVIYKIVCKDEEIPEIYVGSTVEYDKRKEKHRKACIYPKNPDHNYKVYKFIRANGDWKNWKIIKIENYPCDGLFELEDRERFYIETLEATLNTRIPARRPGEISKIYYEKNKEKIRKRERVYIENNREKVRTRRRNYAENNREKLNEQSRIRDKKKKEELGEEYIKKLVEKNKNYKEANKERLAEIAKEPVKCECGLTVRKSGINRHKRTNIHKELMEKLNKDTTHVCVEIEN